MKAYGLKKCSTCQKALAFLADKGTSSVSGFARSTFSTHVEKGRYVGFCRFST